jgi:hypothetical protein
VAVDQVEIVAMVLNLRDNASHQGIDIAGDACVPQCLGNERHQAAGNVRVARGEHGDVMTALVKALGEDGDYPLRAAVARGRNR